MSYTAKVRGVDHEMIYDEETHRVKCSCGGLDTEAMHNITGRASQFENHIDDATFGDGGRQCVECGDPIPLHGGRRCKYCQVAKDFG